MFTRYLAIDSWTELQECKRINCNVRGSEIKVKYTYLSFRNISKSYAIIVMLSYKKSDNYAITIL